MALQEYGVSIAGNIDEGNVSEELPVTPDQQRQPGEADQNEGAKVAKLGLLRLVDQVIYS